MTAQTEVDTLRAKIADFDKKLLEIEADIETKQREAGGLLLDGKNTDRLQDAINKSESQVRTIRTAKGMVEAALIEANKNLEAAKIAEGNERMNEIRKELDLSAENFEKCLRAASVPAQRFEELLKEVLKIQGMGVSLSPLGTWVHLVSGYGTKTFVQVLGEVVEYFKAYKPKA